MSPLRCKVSLLISPLVEDHFGLFTFQKLPRHTVNLGLGLRPELAGLGYGLAFVQAGLAFGKARYAPASSQLTVDPFNARAVKVYFNLQQ